jgi:hypothetical protein
MMAKKDGTNNAKIGRHSRGNSNKLQAQRTARNKVKRRSAAIGLDTPQPIHELREVRAERKALIEQTKHAAHKKAFREAIQAARREVSISTLMGDGGVKLTVPPGLNPKDYKEAMKARIRAHRQGRTG